jgi:GT2 family glycosyltransferase
MDLSVIIVSYNVSAYLKKCLSSVIIASEGIDSEIFVIDNKSSDDSCLMVETEFPDVRLIRNDSNRGFAAANNQAISLAAGKYLLLLNPDTIIPADSLRRCMDFMTQYLDAGALGVRMENADGEYLPESKRALPSVSSAFFKAFGFADIFPGSDLFNRYYLPALGADETGCTEVIAGAFMFIRRDVLDLTGYLDEDYFMYGEDIELSYRIIKAGFRNYYLPEVRITHFKGRSTPGNNYDDLQAFYKAMRIYIRKRSAEGQFKYTGIVLSAGIFVREAIALLNRFLRINFRF